MNARKLVAPLLALLLVTAACGGSDPDTNVVAEAAAAVDDAPVGAPTAVASAAAPTTPPMATATPVMPTPTPSAEPAAPPAGTAPASGELGNGCGLELTPGVTTVAFESEGRPRVYELLVPVGYDANTPTPVVLNFHGLGSSGPEQLAFSDYARVADENGFIVVAPTGVPNPGDTRNSWEFSPDLDLTRDDLQFANDLLDHVIAAACVDQTRVYATGLSAGGYFTSVLICNMAERIAAAASIAGLTHPDDCAPSRPVPYIAFHGTDDAVVPYVGGGVSSLAPAQVVALFGLVIPDEFAQFAAAYGCSATPIETALAPAVTAFEYPACAGSAEATFYRIEGGGHTWPGSALALLISQSIGLGVTTTDIDASVVSWEFFSRHALSG